MTKNVNVKEILAYLDKNKESYVFEGNQEDCVNGFSSYGNYIQGTLTWVKNYKTIEKCGNIQRITLAVVQDGVDVPAAENQIITEESRRVFFELLEYFFTSGEPIEKIGSNTYLSPEVKLGKNVTIGHNCTLDGEITIGDGTRIYNNVNIINNVTIGQNCEIQSGVNIGHDGLSYTEDKEHRKQMIKHYGGTTIGNEVHIGSNCYIARGTIDNTKIGNGSKIGAVCTIAHNCRLGENVTVITGSRILGSVNIGNNAYIASALLKNQVVVGENAVIGLGSVVIRDVKENTTVIGIPAREVKLK